jgi:hypothetical protein
VPETATGTSRVGLRTRSATAAIAPAVRAGLAERVAVLVNRLDPSSGGRSGLPALARILSAMPVIEDRAPSALWLVLSAVLGDFPRPTEVRRFRRLLELDGGWAAIDSLLRELPHRHDPRFRPPSLAFEDDVVCVDVTALVTPGINNEGRAIGLRLLRDWSTAGRMFRPVLWSENSRHLRGLDVEEITELGLDPFSARGADEMVIPFAGYVLLGTVDLPKSAERLIGLGQYAGIATASIGYGIGPLVHGENYARTEGAERFTWHLAAQRSFDTVVAVGDDTEIQYRGWKRMLFAVGIDGPEIVSVTLPADSADDAWIAFAKQLADTFQLG